MCHEPFCCLNQSIKEDEERGGRDGATCPKHIYILRGREEEGGRGRPGLTYSLSNPRSLNTFLVEFSIKTAFSGAQDVEELVQRTRIWESLPGTWSYLTTDELYDLKMPQWPHPWVAICLCHWGYWAASGTITGVAKAKASPLQQLWTLQCLSAQGDDWQHATILYSGKLKPVVSVTGARVTGKLGMKQISSRMG